MNPLRVAKLQPQLFDRCHMRREPARGLRVKLGGAANFLQQRVELASQTRHVRGCFYTTDGSMRPVLRCEVVERNPNKVRERGQLFDSELALTLVAAAEGRHGEPGSRRCSLLRHIGHAHVEPNIGCDARGAGELGDHAPHGSQPHREVPLEQLLAPVGAEVSA